MTANPRLTLPLALMPVILLIVLLALSVALFGADSSYGANQIALLFSAAAVALAAKRTGMTWSDVEQGIVQGISMCIGSVMILMAVGMLIGSWILGGTIPTLIYYGVQVLSPSVFYAATTLICAIVAISVGSSWTVAGTMGIGLMAIASSFDLSPAIAAGAIVSGAYFGDKLSPLSDTTNLAAASTGVDLFDHIKHMLWTTLPSFIIALTLFALIGGGEAPPPEQINTLRASLREQFSIGLHLLLPLAFMLYLAWRRTPALPSLLVSSLVGVGFALVFQPDAVTRLAGDSGGLPQALVMLKGVWTSLFAGFSSESSNPFVDELLSKGGLVSMLNTVSLILCAMAMGGILEKAGILHYLVSAALARVRTNGGLVAATMGTCFTTNLVTADQYIAVAIPGSMYREEFERRGLSRLNLSRTLEDSATMTSALIPWNTCGAYMSATLGIATFSYLPFAFFNYICPIVALIYGYWQIAQKPLEGFDCEK